MSQFVSGIRKSGAGNVSASQDESRRYKHFPFSIPLQIRTELKQRSTGVSVDVFELRHDTYERFAPVFHGLMYCVHHCIFYEGMSTDAVRPPLMLVASPQMRESSKSDKSDGEY